MTHTSDSAASDNLKEKGHELQEAFDAQFEKLLKFMPELRDSLLINRRKEYFEKLTDGEFTTFYSFVRNPKSNLQVLVSRKTAEYIETRRQELGLDKAPSREQEKESPIKIGQN